MATDAADPWEGEDEGWRGVPWVHPAGSPETEWGHLKHWLRLIDAWYGVVAVRILILGNI